MASKTFLKNSRPHLTAIYGLNPLLLSPRGGLFISSMLCGGGGGGEVI